MPAISTTIIGNLTGDPELKFTPAGAPVALFTVAVNERFRKGDEWTDGPTSFVRCVAWRELAEHVAESVGKGDRVMVAGAFRERAYTVESTRDGDSGKRRIWELTADDVGPALRHATAKVTRIRRAGSDVPMPEDPWQGAGTPAAPVDEEPPF